MPEAPQCPGAGLAISPGMKLSPRIALLVPAFFALTCRADNGIETLAALRSARARLHTVRDRLNIVASQFKRDEAEGKPFPDREWASLAETRALLLKLQDQFLGEDEKALAKDRTIPYDRKRLYEILAALDVADVTAAYLGELERVSHEKAGRKGARDVPAMEKEAARNLPRVYSDYRRSEWTLQRATMEPNDLTDRIRESLEMRDLLGYDPAIALDASARDSIADIVVLAVRQQRDATYFAARQAVRKASLESLQQELNRVRTEIEFGHNLPENEKKLAAIMKKITELSQEGSVLEARR